MKPLSKLQKAALAQMARRAFNVLTAKGDIHGITADDWRHDEVERVTGRPGLRECHGSHYNKLAAHFESLAGEDGRALKHLVREQTDSRRQAEVVLLDVLSKASLPLGYAEAIARDKFHCAVLETDSRQCWQLVYTVKSRLTARRRKSATQPSTLP